jgi:Papain family cysteine protease
LVVTIEGFKALDDESSMAAYVLSVGPLSVCLSASSWDFYTDGVMTAGECGTELDHCVQVIGLNLDEGYWTVSRIYNPFRGTCFVIITYSLLLL